MSTVPQLTDFCKVDDLTATPCRTTNFQLPTTSDVGEEGAFEALDGSLEVLCVKAEAGRTYRPRTAGL
jgi:hypothetical protein